MLPVPWLGPPLITLQYVMCIRFQHDVIFYTMAAVGGLAQHRVVRQL